MASFEPPKPSGETDNIIRLIWRSSKAPKGYRSPKIPAGLVGRAKICQITPDGKPPTPPPAMIDKPGEEVPFDTKRFVAELAANDGPPARLNGVEGMSFAEIAAFADVDGDVELLESFGARLREARLFRRIPQPELAKLLRVSRQTISSWETERVPPKILSRAAIRKIAKYLGVRYIWLKDGKGPMIDGEPAPPPAISQALAAATMRAQGVSPAPAIEGDAIPRSKLRGILKRLRPVVREMEDSDTKGEFQGPLKLLRPIVRELEDLADE